MKLQQSNTATVLVHLLQYQGAMEATSSKHLGKPGSEDKYNDTKSCRITANLYFQNVFY